MGTLLNHQVIYRKKIRGRKAPLFPGKVDPIQSKTVFIPDFLYVGFIQAGAIADDYTPFTLVNIFECA